MSSESPAGSTCHGPKGQAISEVQKGFIAADGLFSMVIPALSSAGCANEQIARSVLSAAPENKRGSMPTPLLLAMAWLCRSLGHVRNLRWSIV